MTPKERILATLNHQPTDRTPIDCLLYQRQFVEMLQAEYGTPDQFRDEFNIDMVVGFTPYPNQLGHKIEVYDLAVLELSSPREPKWIAHTDWNEDFAGLGVVQTLERYGDRQAVVGYLWGIVEGTSSFLGIENCWLNLGMEPDLMKAWFDRYADWLCGLLDSCADAGVDLITLSDDWGSNKRMLFAPKLWRDLIKPYAARIVQHARSRGIPVNLHSDGHILDVMDDIVEMGFASIHPVQESAGMDPHLIKEKYGDKLVIYGSLDIIDGLYAYDGEELDEYITKRFEIYAPGGGFIFNTGHFVQPDIPPHRLVRAYTLVNQLAPKYRTLPS